MHVLAATRTWANGLRPSLSRRAATKATQSRRRKTRIGWRKRTRLSRITAGNRRDEGAGVGAGLAATRCALSNESTRRVASKSGMRALSPAPAPTPAPIDLYAQEHATPET